MQSDTKPIIIGTLFIIFFGMFSHAVINSQKLAKPTETAQGSWACTTETQACPDGSTVGRVPPYCQFAACPD